MKTRTLDHLVATVLLVGITLTGCATDPNRGIV